MSYLLTTVGCGLAVWLWRRCRVQTRELERLRTQLGETQEELSIKRHEDNNMLLVKLASGWYQRAEDVQADMEALDFAFPADRFCAAAVQVEDWGGKFPGPDGRLSKRDRVQADYVIGRTVNETRNPQLWLRGFTSADCIVVLACPLCEDTRFFAALREQLDVVREQLERQYEIRISFGVSQLHDGLLSISTAFREAREVLDYKELLGLDDTCLTRQQARVTELRAAAERALEAVTATMSQKKPNDQPAWVLAMAQLIRQRYSDPNLSTATLAEALGLNPTYAARVFRQHQNCGIYEYIHFVRIDAAMALLREGVQVKDAAAAVGYWDTGAMSRAFKKYNGTSPAGCFIPGEAAKATAPGRESNGIDTGI